MHHPLPALALVILGLPVLAPAAGITNAEITTATLLDEMVRLELLARQSDPAFRTVQFSSYDRRSTAPDAPHWYSNSDGFGGEPIPNFAAVLREPDEDGVGLYLVADVAGPGAIVRGWSARMGGVLRVYLDGAEEPVWDGTGFDFLARRARRYLQQAGIEIECGDAFEQQNADYLPMPFARGLRVTWEGRVRELHFYHLQVRLYAEGTRVRTFEPKRDLGGGEAKVREVVQRLTEPANTLAGEDSELTATIAPGGSWSWSPEKPGAGAVTELTLRLAAGDVERALRGTLLRIAFDGASDAQVETPVGDFFATGPGINPHSSLPFTVLADGTMVSRFVMPFARSVEIELRNTTDEEVTVAGSVRVSPWTWDERSMYLRARWRVNPDLRAGGAAGVFDIPYLVARGSGRLVGLATMIVNPTGVPTSYGNWWGEGDEKIFVDDGQVPVAFGTGSEDYYNYSWSRADLFDHPYCGQPLDSGPANAGYVSNHRFQITDSIPYTTAFAAYMELWPHTDTPGINYACVAYCYARPGAIDDHRTLRASDLVVPEFPKREPQAAGAAAEAKFHYPTDLTPDISGGRITQVPLRVATRGSVFAWAPAKGDRLTLRVPILRNGRYTVNVVAVRRPDGATLRATLDGKPYRYGGDSGAELKTTHATRLLNLFGREQMLAEGERELVLECVEAGFVGIDYLWIKRVGGPPKRVKGAIEAEDIKVVRASEGVEYGPQAWAASIWSADRQLWVQPTEKGQSIELAVPVAKPGRYRVEAWLTRSRDYGILQFQLDGKKAGDPIDTFQPRSQGVGESAPFDLGAHELDASLTMKIEVVGTNPKTEAPHYYFGLDCLRLVPSEGE